MSKKANGDVEIVAVSNVLASDGATGLYLKGEAGFLNAETVLKNLCDELYTSSYGEARSINVNDMNSLTGYIPETTTSTTYTSPSYQLWDKSSNTIRLASSENPITVENTCYSYTVEDTMPLYDTLIEETINESDDTGNDLSKYYWLGSRFSQETAFAIGVICNGRVGD